MRLNHSRAGTRIHFICDRRQADKVERVAAYANGKVVERKDTPAGTEFAIEKS